ncbi:hypothetical protein, partial [Marinobacter sp. UBA3607]|uniref:hypothetical protein n=1 Tax=Marinobacter sp. UBA3607 TaxID=1946820 RepID=UPI002580AB91
MWDELSKNRYKHIHVRFSPAIHGLRRFLDSSSHMVLLDVTGTSFSRWLIKLNQGVSQHCISCTALTNCWQDAPKSLIQAGVVWGLQKMCGAMD